MKIWWVPEGMEPLGVDRAGDLIVGDGDGIDEATDMTGYVSGINVEENR